MSEVIRKTVKLLKALKPQEEKEEWSATEISRELDIPVQTVHRLLSSLEECGIVFKNLETKKYRLSLELLKIGFSLRNNLLVRNSALPIMEELVKKTKQSVYLTVPEGDEGVFIDCIFVMQLLQMSEPIGMRVPLSKGASQKVILANMNRNLQKKIIHSLQKRGEMNEIQSLIEEIQAIQKDGVSISFGEITKGTASIAAPIFSWEDEVVASITLNGPEEKFRGNQFHEIKNIVRKAAETISEELGWVKNKSKIGYLTKSLS